MCIRDSDKGDGNPHVHLLVTMRPFNLDHSWGSKEVKDWDFVRDTDGNIVVEMCIRDRVIYFSIIATQWLVRFIKMKRKSDLVLTVLFFVLSILAFVGFVSHLLEVRI